MTEPAPIWAFWCWQCRINDEHTHRHDRDRQRAEHRKQHPTHTVAVGRIIPGRPAAGSSTTR